MIVAGETICFVAEDKGSAGVKSEKEFVKQTTNLLTTETSQVQVQVYFHHKKQQKTYIKYKTKDGGDAT